MIVFSVGSMVQTAAANTGEIVGKTTRPTARVRMQPAAIHQEKVIVAL
jgi:hypothetical protein